MRIRPAHAAGTAPPRFVVGKKRRRSKSEMGDARSADRVYRRSARARQGPHTLRSDGLRLRSRARSPPHLAGCREPNPEIIQERENVLSLVRDGHDACARLDLVLASLCGSTNTSTITIQKTAGAGRQGFPMIGDSQSDRYKCILMYLDVYERDTSRYMHDTS